MNKDFDIEIQDETVEETNRVQLPMNFLTFGEIENDDVKVYIKQDVYKALEKLACGIVKQIGQKSRSERASRKTEKCLSARWKQKKI